MLRFYASSRRGIEAEQPEERVYRDHERLPAPGRELCLEASGPAGHCRSASGTMAMDGHHAHAIAVTNRPARTALGTALCAPSTVTVRASRISAVGNTA